MTDTLIETEYRLGERVDQLERDNAKLRAQIVALRTKLHDYEWENQGRSST